MKSLLIKLDAALTRIGSLLQSPLLLVLRLYFGWQFFQTGLGKLKNLERTSGYFADLHIPAPMVNAVAAGTIESVGGVLLALGLCSRIVSVPLAFTMTVAYLTAELDTVKNIVQDPDKFVSATPFLFLLVALLVLAFGPGRFALDTFFLKKPAPPASAR
jgi:putative oxidoreductase